MYDGYSAGCVRRLMSSEAVSRKIQELALARLNSMTDLPAGTNRQKKLVSLELQFREAAWKISIDMVARMDSVPVRFSPPLFWTSVWENGRGLVQSVTLFRLNLVSTILWRECQQYSREDVPPGNSHLISRSGNVYRSCKNGSVEETVSHHLALS